MEVGDLEADVLITMAMVVVSVAAAVLLLRMEEEGAVAIAMEAHQLEADGREIEVAVVDDRIMTVSVIDPAVQIEDKVVDDIERLQANNAKHIKVCLSSSQAENSQNLDLYSSMSALYPFSFVVVIFYIIFVILFF